MSLTDSRLPEAGRWIGPDYRILKKLGHGGDGTVYLVRHCPTEQLRAAKMLKADVIKQCRHELDMMKLLRHPALPRIYDILEEAGRFWLVMEFVTGKPLSEWSTEQFDPLLFFSIANQLAEVLDYLHSRRPPVLHLDIKPSNIMIQPNGALVLIDFGAAARADPAGSMSARFGTPGFAAPEQSNPDLKLDVRADFYGFGAVLYYCMYGTVPESGRVRRRESVRQKMGWRRTVWPFVERCLQADRKDRFQDDGSLGRNLRKTEKRYHMRRRTGRGSAAFLLLLAAAVFAAESLHWEGGSQAMDMEAHRDYEALLEQAESLGFVQAVACYEQAFALYPEDGSWCEKLLDRIESDYVFSMEEEASLKRLIFSVPKGGRITEEEILEKNDPEYGLLAYRIGLAYWYLYEGAGGRSAAAKWFERAVAWKEKSAGSGAGEEQGKQKADSGQWAESAQIHAKISSYYQTPGKQGQNGSEDEKIRDYWEDLEKLWELDDLPPELPEIKREIANEIVSILIMHTCELENTGIKTEDMMEKLESVETFLKEASGYGQMEHDDLEKCEAARAAIERLAGGERGNSFDAEKK